MATQTTYHALSTLCAGRRELATKLTSISTSFLLQTVIAAIAFIIPSAAQTPKSSHASYDVIRIAYFPQTLKLHARPIKASDAEGVRTSPTISITNIIPRPALSVLKKRDLEIHEPAFELQNRGHTLDLDIRSNSPRRPVELGMLSSEQPAETKGRNQIKTKTGALGDYGETKVSGRNNVRRASTQLGNFDASEGNTSNEGGVVFRGARQIRLSSGFGSDLSGDPRPVGKTPTRTLQIARFDEVDHSRPATTLGNRRVESHTVVILSKPKPIYSNEARHLKIEGIVILETTFLLDGHVNVVRVIRGLGHGLDEAAIAVAEAMTFKPAIDNGIPIVFRGTVQVQFQLAF